MRFDDSGPGPTGAPVFDDEHSLQRGGGGGGNFFDSGSRLDVACPGGNNDATLSSVLHKPPPFPPLGKGEV